MILPQSYAAALLLMILSMLCWGSWANTFKLAGKWRFELFYFDYAFGVLLAATIYALTAGSAGDWGFDGLSFVDDLAHAGKRQWFYGFTAGCIFNLANMLLVAAISVAGLAVAFPVGIGMALVIGVVWNYVIKPQGNPAMLFGGCAIIVGAIIVDAMAYKAQAGLRLEREIKEGKTRSTSKKVGTKGIVLCLVSGVLMGFVLPAGGAWQRGGPGARPLCHRLAVRGGRVPLHLRF